MTEEQGHVPVVYLDQTKWRVTTTEAVIVSMADYTALQTLGTVPTTPLLPLSVSTRGITLPAGTLLEFNHPGGSVREVEFTFSLVAHPRVKVVLAFSLQNRPATVDARRAADLRGGLRFETICVVTVAFCFLLAIALVARKRGSQTSLTYNGNVS
jgi:hypothetical protein